MLDFQKVLALINTLPLEWQAALNHLWKVNVIPNYQKLIVVFVREYYRIEAIKTSTLGLSVNWRQINVPWRNHKGFPSIFPWLPNVSKKFSNEFTIRLKESFLVYEINKYL